MEQGDAAFVLLYCLRYPTYSPTGLGISQQLQAVIQFAAQPGDALSHAHTDFSTVNAVLHAGRCFSGGVNGGGFDSENWILTEVSRHKARLALCLMK